MKRRRRYRRPAHLRRHEKYRAAAARLCGPEGYAWRLGLEPAPWHVQRIMEIAERAVALGLGVPSPLLHFPPARRSATWAQLAGRLKR